MTPTTPSPPTADPIDPTQLDPQFKYDVAAHPGGQNVTLCFSCGTCTAACPVAAIDSEFNPRKIIRQVLLGMRKEVLSDPVLWRCVQCYACTSQCPQNVKFRDVMRALREMAIAEGFVPADRWENVRRLDEFAQQTRRALVQQLIDNPATCETTIEAIRKETQT